ncbi:MAG: histidinol dehydrogenase [Rhodospirillales bacterium]|nr:histidinol dehydrogenase [Rhodospirillales bacterium]
MLTYLKTAASTRSQDSGVADTVRRMIADIAVHRDEAVRRYARDLDRWQGGNLRVTKDEIRRVARDLPETFKEDFEYCRRQVTKFARRQKESLREFEVELEPGVTLGQRLIPVSSVGCYVPGGKYPLVSAAIMSVGTARAAGVNHITACAPPRQGGGIFPPTLYALHAAGADEIYALGGVQAMASMAYGCVGMQPADLITGPGNAFVAEAKRQLFGVVGLDLLAGPTEICVIADDSADPALVATDLLGQAEHGPDSPAWLITTSSALGKVVLGEVTRQLATLPTAEIAGAAWRNHGEIAVVESDDEAIAAADDYAPEHLEVMTRRNEYYLSRLRNYGSLFLGEDSTVAYGDKGIGTNHTLPTNKAARYTGGLWVGKFIKTVTYQKLTAEASRGIAPIMGRVCAVEGMLAHEITATVRFDRYAPRNSGDALQR